MPKGRKRRSGSSLAFACNTVWSFRTFSDPVRLTPVVTPCILSVSPSNQGSFPPPALPGIRGIASPSATLPARPRPAHRGADEPHHRHSERPARHHRRHGASARPLLRHQRRVLAEPPEALRAAARRREERRGDRPVARARHRDGPATGRLRSMQGPEAWAEGGGLRSRWSITNRGAQSPASNSRR